MAAPHLPLPRAVCCGLGSFPSTGSLLWLWPCRDQRDTSQCTPTPCACTQVVQGQSTADRGCPSCLSPSVAPRCLPLCRQSWIHADWSQFPSQKSNVSMITSMQVPSCWINVASYNSPAVSQVPEHPSRLVPGLQLACGQPEGLSVGCVVAIPPHRCTLTPLRALLDL